MRVLRLISSLLQSLFWGLIIFGFEEPYMAIITLISALIHEGGHIIMAPDDATVRGVISGVRIRSSSLMGYKKKILYYAGGPLANLLVAAIFLTPAIKDEYLRIFTLINLATALSNLLPIEGYDGYGILVTLLEMREAGASAINAVRRISNGLIFSLAIFSLCLIDRVGGGYWIYALFFSYLIKVIDSELSSRF